jgi:hypothetical protein
MSDYQEAVQSPRVCFGDAQLKCASPALNPLGLPQPITGGFASVYRMQNGKGSWAVRCFLHRIADIRERYDLISRHLKKSPLKCMVGFDYLPEGIRVKGAWHPVVKMEWSDGDTLNVHVRKNLDHPKALRKLAASWAELIDTLERAGIAHGDLQHGNVLVRDGQFKLIDYDAMFVPSLGGRQSNEKGHPAYQHPQRTGAHYNAQIDRFSALLIYTSLVALAKQPSLWKKFDDEDNLLFRRSDLENPSASPVFKAVEALDPEVAKLAEALRRACEKSPTDAPRLKDVLEEKPKEPTKQATPAPAPAAKPPPVPVSAPPAPAPVATNGWTVAWARPGQLKERHVHKDPVYGTREVPRKFLFFTLGTKRVRFVERYVDRVSERASTVEGHRSSITALAFSPDGGTIASGSRDRHLRVWNTASGREVCVLLDARARVEALAFVPGRSALVASLEDRRLLIWDFGLQRQVIHIDSPDGSRLDAIAVSPDGRWAAAGGTGRSLYAWHVDTGALAGTFEGLDGKIAALAFTDDASAIACATRGGRLELIDRASGKLRWSVRGHVETLAVRPKASSVAGVAPDGRLMTWDLRDGSPLSSADPKVRGVLAVALAPDASHAVLGLDDGTARIVRVADGAEVARLGGHLARVTAAAIAPARKTAVTGCASGSVQFWAS